MLEIYKCVNNINPKYLCDRFTVKVLDYDFRDHYKCVIPMELLNMVKIILYLMVAHAGINFLRRLKVQTVLISLRIV